MFEKAAHGDRPRVLINKKNYESKEDYIQHF